MKYITLLYLLLVLPVLCVAQVDYADQIQPIFTNNCVTCHGGQNGVTLSSYAAVMNSVGQQYGTNVVIPGDADASPIVDKISSDTPEHGARMPYLEDPLSTEQIELIVNWINEGANEMPTSSELIADLPEGYTLKGNFPNPFNPTTNIVFEVPEAISYTVSVYNIQGMLIREMNGKHSAGTVNISVDLASDPSAVYLYKVTAVANERRYLIGSGKMTLIK